MKFGNYLTNYLRLVKIRGFGIVPKLTRRRQAFGIGIRARNCRTGLEAHFIRASANGPICVAALYWVKPKVPHKLILHCSLNSAKQHTFSFHPYNIPLYIPFWAVVHSRHFAWISYQWDHGLAKGFFFAVSANNRIFLQRNRSNCDYTMGQLENLALAWRKGKLQFEPERKHSFIQHF